MDRSYLFAFSILLAIFFSNLPTGDILLQKLLKLEKLQKMVEKTKHLLLLKEVPLVLIFFIYVSFLLLIPQLLASVFSILLFTVLLTFSLFFAFIWEKAITSLSKSFK